MTAIKRCLFRFVHGRGADYLLVFLHCVIFWAAALFFIDKGYLLFKVMPVKTARLLLKIACVCHAVIFGLVSRHSTGRTVLPCILFFALSAGLLILHGHLGFQPGETAGSALWTVYLQPLIYAFVLTIIAVIFSCTQRIREREGAALRAERNAVFFERFPYHR